MRKSARRGGAAKKDLRDFDDDLIVNTPLIAAVERAELPGPLKISNVCFVEKEERVRKQAEGGLVVVVSDRTEIQGDRWGGADVVRFPFRDDVDEPEAIVTRQIQGAVAAVQAHWRVKPGTAVLVHCQAGQNRSGAVVLAVLRAYGVPEAEAERIMDEDLSNVSGVLWGKLLGENGQRMRALVLAMYHSRRSEDDADASVTAADLLDREIAALWEQARESARLADERREEHIQAMKLL